jgi:hypothetical protein
VVRRSGDGTNLNGKTFDSPERIEIKLDKNSSGTISASGVFYMDVIQIISSWTGWPVVVAVMLIAGGYAGWLQKNRIDHLKELNESLKEKAISSEASLISPESYSIRVLHPSLHERVDHSFEVKGTLKKIPKELEIWVFVIKDHGRDIFYWPQEPAVIRDNAWYSKVNYVESGTQRVAIFLVGKNGQTLIHYFKKAGIENSQDGNPRWPAITKLTSDIVQCVTFEVLVT